MSGDYSEHSIGRTKHFQLGTVSTSDLSHMANLHSLAQANIGASNKFTQNRKERNLPLDRGPHDYAANRLAGDLAHHTANMKVSRKSEFHGATTLKPSLGRERLQ